MQDGGAFLLRRGWIADKAPLKIVLEMIKMLPLRNPMGVGLATVLMELLPNPSLVGYQCGETTCMLPNDTS